MNTTKHTTTKTTFGYQYRGVDITRHDSRRFAVVTHCQYGWFYHARGTLELCKRKIDEALDQRNHIAMRGDLHAPDSQWLTTTNQQRTAQ